MFSATRYSFIHQKERSKTCPLTASTASFCFTLGDCGQEIDGEAFDRTLESSLETFISAVEAGGDPTKTTASVCDKVRSGLAQGNVLKPA